jgi:NAD(P)-dependent dehydrogenase (short-subunit alcohol dehydrogenase family)
MLPEFSLEGRTAIVTGAGRGIGRAIALVFAEAGADVVCAARTVSEIENTADEIRRTGRQAMAVPTDVSSSSEVDALIDAALGQFGTVDILVNNAAQVLRGPLAPLPAGTPQSVVRAGEGTPPISDEALRRLMDSNLMSIFYSCRAIAPHMMERKYGKIINISSNSAVQAYPRFTAYNASKAAVNMLTRTLAIEWADSNICVNAIGPGDYKTAMSSALWSDPTALQRVLDNIPFHRGGDVRELGILATYLASPASDYMTGQIIYLDGGLTAK